MEQWYDLWWRWRGGSEKCILWTKKKTRENWNFKHRFIYSVTLMVYVSLELDDFDTDALNAHHVWNSADNATVGFPLDFLRQFRLVKQAIL